jgi:hypothetical protein
MKKSLETIRTELLPQRREQYFQSYIQEARKRMEDNNEIEINDSAVTAIAQQIS